MMPDDFEAGASSPHTNSLFLSQVWRALQFTRKYYARSHTTSAVVLLFTKGSFTCPAPRWMDATPAMNLLLRYNINTCTYVCLRMRGEDMVDGNAHNVEGTMNTGLRLSHSGLSAGECPPQHEPSCSS